MSNDAREVPEDRIKTITVRTVVTSECLNSAEAYVREELIQKIGIGIAEKLFEFDKVLVTKSKNNSGQFVFKAQIEVIVPNAKPDHDQLPVVPQEIPVSKDFLLNSTLSTDELSQILRNANKKGA